MVAHSMSGRDLDSLLGWLEKRPAPNISAIEQDMLKALGMKPPPKKE